MNAVRLSECHELALNSNSILQVLILNRYPLHHLHVHEFRRNYIQHWIVLFQWSKLQNKVTTFFLENSRCHWVDVICRHLKPLMRAFYQSEFTVSLVSFLFTTQWLVISPLSQANQKTSSSFVVDARSLVLFRVLVD